MRKLAHVAAAVLDDVDFVIIVDGLDRRQRDAGLCPQSGQNDFLSAAFFDRRNEVLVIPGIHRGTLDWDLVGKDGLKLRPKIAAETLALHGTEDHRKIKNP